MRSAPTRIDGASIDSRSVRPGQLFVPIVAERDGHDFIGRPLAAGAAAYLTPAPIAAGDPAIVVGDTAERCSTWAGAARGCLPAAVVGITGSVGKTSTKDLLAAVLGTTYATAASERSFNNELGVPLTLLGAPAGTEAVVVEMGARGVGPHRRAVRRGPAHDRRGDRGRRAPTSSMFGSARRGRRGQGRAGRGPARATAPRCSTPTTRWWRPWPSAPSPRSLTFGVAVRGADVRADDVRARRRAAPPRSACARPWGDTEVRLAVRGRHQVVNALAAAAPAWHGRARSRRWPTASPGRRCRRRRMEPGADRVGARILNDAYNANPTSMVAASASAGGARRRAPGRRARADGRARRRRGNRPTPTSPRWRGRSASTWSRWPRLPTATVPPTSPTCPRPSTRSGPWTSASTMLCS